MDDSQARELVARVETLLSDLESLGDPAARETATEVVQAIVELYGEGLGRMVSEIAERDERGELAGALAGDELVAHLLLLHDLHPVPIEERVRGALDEVRPYLDSHGGNVELLGIDEGVARLRMEGSCSGCPSSTVTLKLAIEEAIHKAAPDVAAIEAEGAVEAQPIQLPVAGNGRSWTTVVHMPELASGGSSMHDVDGEQVLFLKLTKSLYAYRPTCPVCAEKLDGAALADGLLACPGCGNRYDVRRAGRCADDPELHLDPVPLLLDGDGGIRVAMERPAAPA